MRQALVIAFTLFHLPAALCSQVDSKGHSPLQTEANRCIVASGQASDAEPADGQELRGIEARILDGRYLAVEPVLSQYVQQHPCSWRAHYDLGYVLFRMRGGRLSLAEAIRQSIRELSRSLQLKIDDADAHKILALDFTMIQREDLAEVEWKQAVRLDPGSPEIHYFLGRHYMGEALYDQARSELETAIRLDSAYMKAYENLGITMDMLGDQPAALRNYMKAIDLDEKQKSPSALPYLDLAKFYDDRHDLNEALTYTSKALRTDSRLDQADFELAKIYLQENRCEDAVGALQKAVSINPYSAQYYFFLGRTYHRLGKAEESRRAFANYVKYRGISDPLPESAEGR